MSTVANPLRLKQYPHAFVVKNILVTIKYPEMVAQITPHLDGVEIPTSEKIIYGFCKIHQRDRHFLITNNLKMGLRKEGKNVKYPTQCN